MLRSIPLALSPSLFLFPPLSSLFFPYSSHEGILVSIAYPSPPSPCHIPRSSRSFSLCLFYPRLGDEASILFGCRVLLLLENLLLLSLSPGVFFSRLFFFIPSVRIYVLRVWKGREEGKGEEPVKGFRADDIAFFYPLVRFFPLSTLSCDSSLSLFLSFSLIFFVPFFSR